MTGFNGNSFSDCSLWLQDAPPRRVPPWKLGVGPAAMSDDRGGM